MPVVKAGLCPFCDESHLVRDSSPRTLEYHGQTIYYSVPGATCDACGKRYIGPAGAGAAGDRVRAQEAAIDTRALRKKRKTPELKYQAQEEFFEKTARDVQKFRVGKQTQSVVTASADPALRPTTHQQRRRAPKRKNA